MAYERHGRLDGVWRDVVIVAGQLGVGIAEGPHGHVRRRPRPDAGQGQQVAGGLGPVRAPVEHQVPGGHRRGHRVQGPGAPGRQPDGGQRRRVGGGQVLGRGEVPLDAIDRVGERSAEALGQPPGQRPGPGHRDLLAEHGPHGQLTPVDGAGRPQPGSGRHQVGQGRVGPQVAVDGDGIGVEVEQVPAPRHGRTEVAQVLEAEPGVHDAVPGDEPHHARAVGQVEGTRQRGVAGELDAGHGPAGQEAEQVVGGQGAAVGQAEVEPARRWTIGVAPVGAGPATQLAGGGGEHGAHHVVELAHAGEPGGEGHLGHGQVGALDQGPGRLGPAGAGQVAGAGAELGHQQAV